MFAWLAVCFVVTTTAQKSVYDHQTKTYVSSFEPVAVKGKISVEGFFSPDHSADTLSALIATASKTLDIGTPSVSTWLRHHDTSDCTGLPVSEQTKETFPLFNATLNALHRGVKVRLLTNNYENKLCPNMIDPLTFFLLAGVEVTYYASTSFMHAKYIQVDGKKASVSSVNWSRNSFTNNREAGMIVSSGDASDSAAPLLEFLTSVFEDDLHLGIPYTNPPSFSDADLKIINDTAVRPVSLPSPPSGRAFVSPVPEPVASDMEVVAFTSPDYALTTLEDDIASANSSLEIYIYQINNDDICDLIHEKFQIGINVTILVSPQIYSEDDQAGAYKCYDYLVGAGLEINLVYKYDSFYFSHNKYWIVDEKRVGVSTGNWAPTDFPGPPNSYPPYGDSGWRKTNRDFTLRVTDPQIVHLFRQVMQGDMQNSDIYIPKEPGTCATFGCNITYQSHHSCQCNSKCLDYGNCCSDYISHCLDPHASCQKFGCNISFNKENACQCDPDCWKEKQGCCSDWTSLCAYHAPSTTTNPDNRYRHIVFNVAVAVAIIFFGIFILVIMLIVFFAMQYTRRRRALSKSFASSGANVNINEHQVSYRNNMDIADKKTPLLNEDDRSDETDTQHESIFPGNEHLDNDYDGVEDDYGKGDDDDKPKPLSTPGENHHVTNDEGEDNDQTLSSPPDPML